jgi:tRNA dimethylallyltransferase
MPKEISNDKVRNGAEPLWSSSSSFDIRASSFRKRPFFVVGPTAIGKSDLAADVAAIVDAEVVSADAFQIYRGLDLLSAKPMAATCAKAPHHLIGTVSLDEEMSAEKFRTRAIQAIAEIGSRGRNSIVVGGSGLYLKALTHGLMRLPPANQALRHELNALDFAQLRSRLVNLDPKIAGLIDLKNRRRVVRALEICLLTGKPVSEQRRQWDAVAGVADPGLPRSTAAATTSGVFVFRDREELYQRINERVEIMFKNGVVDDVAGIGAISSTASQMIGLAEIRKLLAGETSMAHCIAQIQQSTRRYAKRQLTWFARQSNLEPLNLSLLSHGKAVEWVTQLAKAFGVANRDD